MTEIEKRRKEKGYTQQFMSEEIDTSIGCYNMYENNQRKVPKEKAILSVQKLFCKESYAFKLMVSFQKDDIAHINYEF